LGQNFDSTTGELKMMASLLDKDSEDTEEENRHSATSAILLPKDGTESQWGIETS
jgi:hypothetical protein